MENVIEIKNLKKYFNDVKAVDDISFEVKEGEFFAFLGVNGAGKSTTISIMSGDLQKDEGSVNICGFDIDKEENKIKSLIGIVYQSSFLDKNLSVYDNLKIKAGLYGITGKAFEEKLEYLQNLLNFKDLLKRDFGKLSGGQKRKIDIARALLHDPKILILDEPTTGLDPQTRVNVWKVLNDLRRNKGLTIFLTTHYMEEASEADYVIILDSGKIVAKGTPNYLKNAYANDFIRIYNPTSQKFLEEISKQFDVKIKSEKQYAEIEIKDLKTAMQIISSNPAQFTDYEVIKGRMDIVFLNVTGKNIKEIN